MSYLENEPPDQRLQRPARRAAAEPPGRQAEDTERRGRHRPRDQTNYSPPTHADVGILPVPP